jgi:hypothetical protein
MSFRDLVVAGLGAALALALDRAVAGQWMWVSLYLVSSGLMYIGMPKPTQ